MTPARFWLVLLPALLISGARAAESTATAAANVAGDATPVLFEGTLPNGLRYVFLSHASAKGGVSFRLVVHAGSLDERDDERGFAHFVEHMAFQGTRRFPPGTIRYFFQHLGLAFGADLNAGTGHRHTFYMVDLPEGRSDKFAEALAVLRDYADGLQFPPDELTREAGVVNSERLARDNSGSRLRDQVIEVIFAGTPLPERNPIGVAEHIARATPAQLRAFYQRNYTPERMTLVVVGAIDVEQARAQVHAEFASMRAAPGSTPPSPPLVLPALEEVTAHVLRVPTMRGSAVNLSAIGPRLPATPEGLRRELVERIAIHLLRTRLITRRERGDQTHFGPPNAERQSDLPGPMVAYSLSIGMGPTGWDDGLRFLETELRRAGTEGFTQPEVDEAVAIELNGQRNRVADFPGFPADRVAGEIMRILMQGGAWRAPAVASADSQRALQGLTAAEVTATLREILPGDRLRLIVLAGPDTSASVERILAVYEASTGRALRKSRALAGQLEFQYTDFGPPGAVARRERIEDLDLTLVAFANEVRLNFRPSTTEPDRFRLRIVFPQNFSDVPKSLGGLSEVAGMLLLHSQLGRHPISEVERLTKLHGINAQFTVANGTPILGLSGPVSELRFALQLLTAQLSDLRFDDESYRVAVTHYSGRERALRTDAVALATNEALYHHLQRDERVVPHSGQAFARLPPSRAEGWLREHILRGPLEVGIVGDLAADDVVAVAAASLGTLKPRQAAPKRGAPLKPVATAVRVQGKGELPASAAVACVLWPVTLPDDPRHNAALAVAVEAFRDRLFLALRELLGSSYSPQARTYRDLIQRDFAYATMISTFDPPRAQQMTEGAVRLGGRLAEAGLSEAQFVRLREPLRTRHLEDLRDNGWWLNAVVSIAQSRPAVLDAARRHGTIMDEITLADVNAALKVFDPAKVTIAILLPEEKKP